MSAGKGDSPRNCFSDTFRDNYDHIFRKPETYQKLIHWANFAGIDKEGAVDDVSQRWISYDTKTAQAAVGELDGFLTKKSLPKSVNIPQKGRQRNRRKDLPTNNDDI